MPIYRKGQGQMDGLYDRARAENNARRDESKAYRKSGTPISPESALYRRSQDAGENPEWHKVSDIIAAGEDRPFNGAGLAEGNRLRKLDESENGELRAYQKTREAKKMARTQGAGIIQGGKLVKGGNTSLQKGLEKNN